MNSSEIYLYEILQLLKGGLGLNLSDDIPTSSTLAAAVNVIEGATYSESHSVELWNLLYRGVYIILDVNSVPGQENIELFVDILNPSTAQYTCIAQMGTVSDTGVYKYLLYHQATDTDSELTHITQLPIPRRWRIRMSHSGSGDWIYSVGIQYVS